MAVPKYYDTTTTAKLNTLQGQLGTIRGALSLYYADQALSTGTATYPTTLSASLFSDGTIPVDPYDSASTVTVTAEDPITTFSGVGGWVYNAATGEVRANVTGHTAL